MREAPALLAEATVTIGGKEVPADAAFDVINPATAQVLAVAPAVSRDQLDMAVSSAHAAFATWRGDEAARLAAMLAAADVLDANAEALGALLTAEQGKPLGDAGMEVMAASWWLRHFAALDLPVEVVQDDEHGYAEVYRRPLGVVARLHRDPGDHRAAPMTKRRLDDRHRVDGSHDPRQRRRCGPARRAGQRQRPHRLGRPAGNPGLWLGATGRCRPTGSSLEWDASAAAPASGAGG